MPAAFFVVYFGWGSTFLAGRIALDAAPPFLLAAARSFAAGLALYAWAAFTGRLRPASWRAWGGAAVIGSLFFLGGYGLLFVGMPLGSGISATLDTTIPLWILLMVWMTDEGATARPRELLGVGAYLWLLSRVSPAKASSYAFVNPVVAVALGWMILSEPISLRTLLAAAITIAGVALVLTAWVPSFARRRKHSANASNRCAELARG